MNLSLNNQSELQSGERCPRRYLATVNGDGEFRLIPYLYWIVESAAPVQGHPRTTMREWSRLACCCLPWILIMYKQNSSTNNWTQIALTSHCKVGVLIQFALSGWRKQCRIIKIILACRGLISTSVSNWYRMQDLIKHSSAMLESTLDENGKEVRYTLDQK
jgi:hypothetical protein